MLAADRTWGGTGTRPGAVQSRQPEHTGRDTGKQPTARPGRGQRLDKTIETNIVGGLESLGGFGGVADKLNAYNHYLGTPDYLQQDVARYRAVTPASVQEFAKTYLVSDARVVVHAVPGEPPAQVNVPTPPAPKPAGAGRQGRAASSLPTDWR